MGDSAYSYSLTTFSNSGKLIQIEHALKCVQQRGKLTVGIRAADGVVLATTKRLSPLVAPQTFPKICQITDTIFFSYAGMSPDYRILVSKARKRSEAYYLKYNTPISTPQLTRLTAEIMQEFTQQGGVRPFGVSLLIAGFDDVEADPFDDHEFDGKPRKFRLYQADASGAYFEWNATAIGARYVSAKEFLEKRLFAGSGDAEVGVTIEIESAVDEAIRCLKQESDEELRPQDLEVGIVDKQGFKMLEFDELKTILENLN